MSSKDKKAPNGNGSSSSDDDFYDNFDKYKKRRLKGGAKLEPSNHELTPKREPKPPPVKEANRRGRSTSSSSDSSIDVDDGLSALERVKRRAEKFKERREDVAKREVDVFEEELHDGPRPSPTRTLPDADNENLTNLLRSTKDDLEDVFPGNFPGDFAETSRLDLAEITTESFQSIPRRCMIHLRVGKTGKSTVVGCNMSEPFRKLIEEHAPKMGIDAGKAVLMGRDCRYSPDQTPEGVGLSEENVTEMDLFEEVPDPESGFLPLKVQIRGKRPFVAKVPPDQRFAVLKESICREHALDVKKARMVFDNEQLDDNSTPEEMEMEADDCIDVWIGK